jgi:hypothetical protein
MAALRNKPRVQKAIKVCSCHCNAWPLPSPFSFPRVPSGFLVVFEKPNRSSFTFYIYILHLLSLHARFISFLQVTQLSGGGAQGATERVLAPVSL